MSKPIYVTFEVTSELMEKVYECVKLAAESGKIKKGANESTKAVERNLAKLLVIAQDVDPPEIVAHLPLLSDEKKIPYVYVDSKSKLGEVAGIEVSASAVAILDPGKGKPLMDEIIAKVSEIRFKGEAKEEVPKEAEAPKEAPKKEEKPKRKKAEK